MFTGNPIHRDGHIGAVVGVEAAQEDLFGFAAAGVLGNDEARHQLQHLMGRAIGADVQIELTHGPRGGRREGSFAVNQHFAHVEGAGGQGDDQAGLLFRGHPHGVGEGGITDLTDFHLVGTRRHYGQQELTVHVRGGPQQGTHETDGGSDQRLAGILVVYLATQAGLRPGGQGAGDHQGRQNRHTDHLAHEIIAPWCLQGDVRGPILKCRPAATLRGEGDRRSFRGTPCAAGGGSSLVRAGSP